MNQITNHHEYEQALTDIDDLMDAMPNMPRGDRLDILATLITDWEERHYPIDPSDVDAHLGNT